MAVDINTAADALYNPDLPCRFLLLTKTASSSLNTNTTVFFFESVQLGPNSRVLLLQSASSSFSISEFFEFFKLCPIREICPIFEFVEFFEFCPSPIREISTFFRYFNPLVIVSLSNSFWFWFLVKLEMKLNYLWNWVEIRDEIDLRNYQN